jgi:outer membrane protein assembly factor BamB
MATGCSFRSPTDGEPRWTRPLGGAPGRILPDEDRVFVGAQDNFFYCLDVRAGSVDWRWRTAADVVAQPAIDADRVYFVSLDNVLRALDRSHGAQRWRRALTMRALDGPFLNDDRLYVSGLSPDVEIFDARNGAPAGKWSGPAELGAPIVPVPGGGSVLFVAIAGAISGEWVALGVGLVPDPPIVPLSVVPGTPLPPEAVPTPRGS